jgi:hypothetical protein
MKDQFFVSMTTWAKVRGDYSQAEKDKLNAAITGEALCPRGVFLDTEKLGAELTAKIRAANKATNALVQR